jgi:hypothetical protein
VDEFIDEDGEMDDDTHGAPPLFTSGDKGMSTPVHKGSPQRAQALSLSVNTQPTVTNTQKDKVVNRTTKSVPLRDRESIGSDPSISDRALRSAYGLSDDQIRRVHWLVDRQVEILGSADRNHAFYVKRAAEAVQAGDDGLLDRMLGELKQAATTIAVASRPAYFHRMYTDALEKHSRPAAIPATSRGLFRPPEDEQSEDPRTRLIADAEERGFVIPDHIRSADIATVNRWWAGLMDGSPSL